MLLISCIGRRWVFLLIGLSLLDLQFAEASSLTELLKAAEEQNLAHHSVWLKLLHYGPTGNQSEVISDNFFISEQGRFDPKAELSATIEAYFDGWVADTDTHARCQYPARYYWLSEYLALPKYSLRDPRCKRLEKWALFDRVQSISLLLVSGYFGNPASTFGHALLKLNTDFIDDPQGLFDLAINYGALVPENEATLLYVIKGLFGGYESGFSDKYFYTQDLVYSRTEFRDIWDYRFALSDYERTLLVLHIWEIIGKKFNYFFLDKNCGYRIAELLELVIDEKLLKKAKIWYLPVEIFHRLNEIDVARRKKGKSGLIESVHFIPSSQRKLYYQFAQLLPDEAKATNVIIQEGPSVLSTQLSIFTLDRKIKILDAVLSYHQYRLISEGPNPSVERRKAKDQVLLARLRLPAHSETAPEVPTLHSPAQGSRPMAIAINLAIDTNEELYWRLNWAAFSKELVGPNSLEGGELVVFDIAVGFDNDTAFVDQFDLIRIQKLNTAPVEVTGESRWSWNLRMGVTRTGPKNKVDHDGGVSFGLGRAWQLNKIFTLYSMAEIAAHTLSPIVRLRPNINIIANIGKIRAWGFVGAEPNEDYSGVHSILEGKLQYQIGSQHAIRIDVSNYGAKQASVGIVWYW